MTGIVPWVIGGVVSGAVLWAIVSAARRKRWAPVLEAETKRWSAKSCAQLAAELTNEQAYEVEFESRQYQVEVQLLENTPKYLHVLVSVDDGSLPASISPLSTSFLRYKEGSGPDAT